MPDVERILQLTPGTLSQQWYEDGVAVDPGTVTLGITRADGTVLLAAGTATTGTGTAARMYNLTTTHTALLDNLTVTWASTLKGTLVSYVEIVGGYLFTLAEARALTPLDNVTVYPTASLIAMRTMVEQEIEEACDCAFVPRYAYETVSGPGGPSLLLRPLVTRIRSATVGGVALSAGDLTALAYSLTGSVYSSTTSWTQGTSNIVVGYEHGYAVTPFGIKRAALLLAKMWLVGARSPIDDRAATFSATEGGTYSLVVPGRNGSTFGHPDVDAALDRYKLTAMVA